MAKEKKFLKNEVMKLSSAHVKKVDIAVDGCALPLKIGDKIDIGDGIVRVVMKVQINEDANVTYGLQWVDGIDFKIDWFSLSELCYMQDIITQKPKIGI